MIEVLALIYVSVNVPINIWHLVIVLKRQKDQVYMKHLKESIVNRDATISRQEQMLARAEKINFRLEEELK